MDAEVIDIRCLTPIDIYFGCFVEKTGYLVVADTGQEACGIAAEVISQVAQKSFTNLKGAPKCVTLPHIPTPTSPALADHFYPDYRANDCCSQCLGCASPLPPVLPQKSQWRDTPDPSFIGPYDETRRHFWNYS